MPKRQAECDMENPEEHFAWAFAAGVPDPRMNNTTFQMVIPPPCFASISRMLWDFGFRHNPELQTRWVPEYAGADRNFTPLGVTDVRPDNVVDFATQMVAEEFPEVAARIARTTPENHEEMAREQAKALLESVARLKAATAQANKVWEGSE